MNLTRDRVRSIGWAVVLSVCFAATMAPTRGVPELISGLRQAGTKVVLVSFLNPYLALGLPTTDAHLIAWSPWSLSQRAAARALLGKAPITGQLPISLPGIAPYGAGIRR